MMARRTGAAGMPPRDRRRRDRRPRDQRRVQPDADKTIGLAFVKPALAAPGTRLCVRLDRGGWSRPPSSRLPFYDPELRQKDAAPRKRLHREGDRMTARFRAAPQSRARRTTGRERSVARDRQHAGRRALRRRRKDACGDSRHRRCLASASRGIQGAGRSGVARRTGPAIPDAPNAWNPLAGGGFIARLG